MSNVTDLKEYKKAKIIAEDLKNTIHIFNLTITALKFFSKYDIVAKTVSVLQTNKTLLEIHYNKYKKIINNG